MSDPSSYTATAKGSEYPLLHVVGCVTYIDSNGAVVHSQITAQAQTHG